MYAENDGQSPFSNALIVKKNPRKKHMCKHNCFYNFSDFNFQFLSFKKIIQD